MSLLDKIKNDVKKSGSNKGKIMYFREGVKTRIRFLNDMDDGMEVVFHDNFNKGINVPCQEVFGRECPYCEEEDIRTRSMYAWSVWDYDAKEVKLLLFAVNNCSPIPALMAMYETYGTLTDRDYVVSKSGKQQNTTYSVVPMDKVRFRNEKAKPFSEKSVLKIIDKAYPCDGAGEEDEDEDEKPKRRPGKSTQKAKTKKHYDEDEEEEEDTDDWGDDGDDDEDVDYTSMSPKELFKLCKERGIEVQPKKPAKYYITQLEEYDKAQDDWGDEEDEDDWEDEE